MECRHRHDNLRFYNILLMLYYPTIIRFSLALILLFVVAGVLSDSVLGNADEDQVARIKGWEVTVTPVSFSYGEEITIAMSGLPRKFPFDTTSVSLGGARVHVHTQGGGRNARPLSDDDGKLEVKASIVEWSSFASQYLKVDIPNIFVARTLVEFKPVNLRISSAEIVPHQEVWISAVDFTKRSSDNRRRSIRINENSSVPDSFPSVTIGGEAVVSPHIDFPVTIGRDGGAFFKITVPELKSTITPGQVELRVIDSEGKEGSAMLTVPAANLNLVNYISYPGENVAFELTGLPARREGFDNQMHLKYGYSLDSAGNKYAAVDIGSFTVNETGGLSGSFDIPKPALLASSNKVWVEGIGGMTWEFIHHLADLSLSPVPASGFQGYPVEITIKGLPANFFVQAGSLYLGDYQLRVPGYFGETGDKPVSNDSGSVTFSSVVPNEISPGYHSMTLKAPGGKTATSTYHVLTNRLHFDPPWAVPGQLVTMKSDSYSVKVLNVSILGSGASYVSLDDGKMFHDVLDYPIPIASDGKFEVTFELPADKEMLTKDRVEITATDTAGRTTLGTLYLKQESVVVTPVESIRGTNIVVEGNGFFANANNSNVPYRALISYGGVQIGSAPLDDIGSFKTSLIVPGHAVVGAKNEITVALVGRPSVKADANHTVPKAAVQVTPDVASAGDRVKVTGSGYTEFRQITIGMGHLWAAEIGPKVYTDVIGNFEIFVTVPESLNKGLVSLGVYAPYPQRVATVPFEVR